MRTALLVILVLITSAGLAKNAENWNLVYKKTVGNYIVSVRQLPPTRYMDPNAKLVLEVRDVRTRKIIGSVDITPTTNTAILYGAPTAEILSDRAGNQILVFQCWYGGDGDPSGNKLWLIDLSHRGVRVIRAEYVSKIKLVKSGNVLIKIRGTYFFTLCMNCDIAEYSDPKDLFKVPMEMVITPKGIKRFILLSTAQRKALIKKMDVRIREIIRETIKRYGLEGVGPYKEYLYTTRKDLIKLIGDKRGG